MRCRGSGSLIERQQQPGGSNCCTTRSEADCTHRDLFDRQGTRRLAAMSVMTAGQQQPMSLVVLLSPSSLGRCRKGLDRWPAARRHQTRLNTRLPTDRYTQPDLVDHCRSTPTCTRRRGLDIPVGSRQLAVQLDSCTTRQEPTGNRCCPLARPGMYCSATPLGLWGKMWELRLVWAVWKSGKCCREPGTTTGGRRHQIHLSTHLLVAHRTLQDLAHHYT